jgi:lactose/L-arabinose transport system permease protein
MGTTTTRIQSNNGLVNWVEDRLPIFSFLSSHTSGYYAPKNFNLWYYFGSLALIVLVNFWPMIQALFLSLQTGRGTRLSWAEPLWLNYQRLFEDETFRLTLSTTFIYLIIQVPIMLVLAMVLANLLNAPWLRFKGFWRTAIFLPCAVGLVSYALVFRQIFATDGLANDLLIKFGLLDANVNWLGQTGTARMVIILGLLWRWTGYNMIFYLSALQNIDQSIYEAARIDGISARGRFLYLTIPMLKPVILFTTVTSTIGTLVVTGVSLAGVLLVSPH